MSTRDERREALKQRGKLPEPVRRKESTQATLDKFKGQPFDWGEGRHCVRLAHFHLRQMGQKPPTLPRIRSALAAKKALKERGWASVSDMLDSILVRIPPAMMQLGTWRPSRATKGWMRCSSARGRTGCSGGGRRNRAQ